MAKSWSKIEAAKYASKKLNEHGLSDRGWTFKFNNNKRRHGVCKYWDRRIELSLHALALGKESCMNTILHEVAHALVPGANHGPRWKRKAIEIGCNGKRCASATLNVKPSWVGKCRECGFVYNYHRRPKLWRESLHWLDGKSYKSPYSCAKCKTDDLRFVKNK